MVKTDSARPCELPVQLQETQSFGPEVCWGVSPRVCPIRVFEGVAHRVSAGSGSGVSKKCLESVPGVSGTPF